MRTIVLMFAGVSLASCITASPQNKPVLTAVEHDSAAARAEQLAQQEQKRRDPGPYVTARCGPPPFAPTSTIVASPTSSLPPSPPSVAGPLNEPCSSSSINFERDHEQEARRLERQATTHRVAAAKLRGAEAVACSGLSEDERTADLLVPRDQVLAVRAVPDHSRTGKASSQSGGATLLLREQPGRSPDQIKHMLECQVARSRTSCRLCGP